jgi:hypothetical protein
MKISGASVDNTFSLSRFKYHHLRAKKYEKPIQLFHSFDKTNLSAGSSALNPADLFLFV